MSKTKACVLSAMVLGAFAAYLTVEATVTKGALFAALAVILVWAGVAGVIYELYGDHGVTSDD